MNCANRFPAYALNHAKQRFPAGIRKINTALQAPLCAILFLCFHESKFKYAVVVKLLRRLCLYVGIQPDKLVERLIPGYGEYYFLLPDYDQSASAFQTFVQEFPDSNGKLFAWVHLLKIAQIQKDEALTKNLEKEIINFKQLSLVFRDFQEYRYQSSLGRKYRAVFQIDKIEFYVQGEMFAQIRY